MRGPSPLSNPNAAVPLQHVFLHGMHVCKSVNSERDATSVNMFDVFAHHNGQEK